MDIRDTGYLLIQPGDFAVVTVFEEIKMGLQHVSRIGLRTKYSRKGLIATTGPQIDPGYHGRLTIGVTNLTPTPGSLPFKDDFVSLEIHRLEMPAANPYSGPYQDRLELGPEEIAAVTEGTGMAVSEVSTTLASRTQKLTVLTNEIRMIKWAVPIIVGIGFAVVGIMVSVK